jgi:hypothetical protein
LRSCLDTAELTVKGLPSVVIVEPTWYPQAKLIAKSVKLPEAQIVVLPIGKVSSNSVDCIPIIDDRLEEIMTGIVKALGAAAAAEGRKPTHGSDD